MILYINRFYIAMCVLRSISQYIGLMLTDDRVARRVLLKKNCWPASLWFIHLQSEERKNDYEIVFDLFFKKKTENYFEKGRGWGHKGTCIFKNEEVWRYSNEHPSDAFWT